MSDERTILDYVEDIAGAISDIRSFVHGMSADTFIADKKTVNAVVRSLEIIGEATGKIPMDVREKYPNVPWEEIIGMIFKVQIVSESTAQPRPKAMNYGPPQKAAAKPVSPKTVKLGRNDPCPCGSGKKYKKCCLLKEGQ